MQRELVEVVERARADGVDMVGLSISYQMRGRTYKLLADYLTEHDGEIADCVPDFLGMGSVYLAIDDIAQIGDDMLEVAKLCLLSK